MNRRTFFKLLPALAAGTIAAAKAGPVMKEKAYVLGMDTGKIGRDFHSVVLVSTQPGGSRYFYELWSKALTDFHKKKDSPFP